MKSSRVVLLLICTCSVAFADDYRGVGNWNDPNNWSGGAPATGAVEVKVRGEDTTVTLNTSTGDWGAGQRMRVYEGASMIVEEGAELLGAGWLRVGASNAGWINQTGGLVRVTDGGDTARLGIGDSAGGEGHYTISGGTLTYESTGNGDLVVGARGGLGVLTVVGTGAVIQMQSMTVADRVGASGTVDFKLTADGVSPITIDGSATLDPEGDETTAALVISSAGGLAQADVLLIDMPSGASVAGSFDTANGGSAEEGALVVVHDGAAVATYSLTYMGGDEGNDVVLHFLSYSPAIPFSLVAYGDVTIDNGSRYGQEGASAGGSGLEARDIPDRRHVFLISYDISGIKNRGDVAKTSFSHMSFNLNDATNVYGVLEDVDLLDVESLTWATAPGVQNDPLPELNSPVTAALDMNELTDVLLTFAGPGDAGVRFSTDTSDALAEFVNSDTDGILTFLFAPAAEGNQLIVRARQIEGGTLLQGETAPIANVIYVTSAKDQDIDGVQDDLSWGEWLTAAGYNVDVRPDNWSDPLDDGDIAELEAADLIIASRGMSTGDFDGAETPKWNALTTPIICTNAWMIRSNRWAWMNSASANKDAGSPFLMAVDATHPVFEGVTLDPDGLVEILDPTVASGHTSFLNDILDVGNGALIAQSLGVYTTTWIAEWQTGVEYYDGAGQIAGGHRLLFMAGTQDDPYLAPNGNISPVGVLNLNDAGRRMFLNAIDYMLSN